MRSHWPDTKLASSGSDDDVKAWVQAVVVAFGGFEAINQPRVPDDDAWRQAIRIAEELYPVDG